MALWCGGRILHLVHLCMATCLWNTFVPSSSDSLGSHEISTCKQCFFDGSLYTLDLRQSSDSYWPNVSLSDVVAASYCHPRWFGRDPWMGREIMVIQKSGRPHSFFDCVSMSVVEIRYPNCRRKRSVLLPQLSLRHHFSQRMYVFETSTADADD
jgi:hypothetical protein